MLFSYTPIAKIRTSPFSIFVKSVGFQNALRMFCPIENGQPRFFQGFAELHLEPGKDLDRTKIRVEIQGRTIGYLENPDDRNYIRKLAQEGLGEYPVVIPVNIRGGSLGNEGPPFYFFAELKLNLDLNYPWEYEPLNGEVKKPSRKKLSVSVPGTATPSDFPIQSGSNGNAILAEKFGRGLGFMVILIGFFVAYCLILLFGKSF